MLQGIGEWTYIRACTLHTYDRMQLCDLFFFSKTFVGNWKLLGFVWHWRLNMLNINWEICFQCLAFFKRELLECAREMHEGLHIRNTLYARNVTSKLFHILYKFHTFYCYLNDNKSKFTRNMRKKNVNELAISFSFPSTINSCNILAFLSRSPLFFFGLVFIRLSVIMNENVKSCHFQVLELFTELKKWFIQQIW